MRERGSALMLMPAAALVVVLLGALAVDSAVVFLAERELANVTAAAANDAAGAAVSHDRFYDEAVVALDPAVAEAVARRAVAASAMAGLEDLVVSVTTGTTGVPTVTVSARARVEHLFARAVPGAPDSAPVGARSTATATLD